MEVAVLREKLHEYINIADEQHLSAIYVLIGDAVPHNEDAINDEDVIFDEETMAMIYQRRENHRNGISKSYRAEDSINLARQRKK